jgi:hypothetical protein
MKWKLAKGTIAFAGYLDRGTEREHATLKCYLNFNVLYDVSLGLISVRRGIPEKLE